MQSASSESEISRRIKSLEVSQIQTRLGDLLLGGPIDAQPVVEIRAIVGELRSFVVGEPIPHDGIIYNDWITEPYRNFEAADVDLEGRLWVVKIDCIVAKG